MSNETNKQEYLLKVDHLKQYFPVRDGFKKMELKAVDDVSFAIRPGETLGLVGESDAVRQPSDVPYFVSISRLPDALSLTATYYMTVRRRLMSTCIHTVSRCRWCFRIRIHH